MGLLDIFTGGKSGDASESMRKALNEIGQVKAPSQEQLTLPQLQQYVEMGIMTPAQAKAYLIEGNAYDKATGSQAAREAEMTALNQLQDVAKSKGMTPQLEARMIEAMSAANTNTQGQRASIMDQMAQRGIPTSLFGAAAQMAAAGQDAESAKLAGAKAVSDAEDRALSAMSASGNLSGNMEQQTFNEQAQKAAAQNAISQWNAANQTQGSQFNAANEQQAGMYNAQNKQNVSNANTGNANYRTQYNAEIPQKMFNNSMEKANAMAGTYSKEANLNHEQGKQNAGITSGIIDMASNGIAKGFGGQPKPMYAADGAVVPGKAEVHGDSPKNDTVHARLSPGEIVLPRSVAMSNNAPDKAKAFVSHLMTQKRRGPVHPRAVDDMIDALSRYHAGGMA